MSKLKLILICILLLMIYVAYPLFQVNSIYIPFALGVIFIVCSFVDNVDTMDE